MPKWMPEPFWKGEDVFILGGGTSLRKFPWTLLHDEKVIGCSLSKAAGAAFVKTSTGFGKGGATAEDISLMRRIVGDDMGVKASGGVKTLDDAKKMIAAGANRIGASASVAIVTGKKSKSSGY